MITDTLRLNRLNHLIEVAQNIPAEKFNMSYWMRKDTLEEEYPGAMPTSFVPVECTSAGCLLGWAGLDKEFRNQGLSTYTLPGAIYGSVQFKGELNGGAAQLFFGIGEGQVSDLFAPSCYNSYPILRGDVIDKIKHLIRIYSPEQNNELNTITNGTLIEQHSPQL